MDWEAELAVVVGVELKDADEAQAAAGIAGYTVANDVSMRDWQNRTLQWFQGKAFDASTPVGPVLVTPEELPEGMQGLDAEAGANGGLEVRGYVNGELVQRGNSSHPGLRAGPAAVLYIPLYHPASGGCGTDRNARGSGDGLESAALPGRRGRHPHRN